MCEKDFAESILDDLAEDCEGDPKKMKKYWCKISSIVVKKLEEI